MKKLMSLTLCVLLIIWLSLAVSAVESVPKPVLRATESVVRVLAKYADGYGSGSGFVIKSDRESTLIVTNYHVVEDNPYSISVWIGEEETVSATILAYTNQKDMCVLELAYPVSLKALTLSDHGAKQGEAVYAVGFPAAADILSDKEAHTSADSTITDGIVSAVREATVSAYGTPTTILQINAAINSGNSGGPLFDKNGEVVGINTYGISDSQGIFGAIDVSELKSFLADNHITVAVDPGIGALILTVVMTAAVVIAATVVVIIMIKKKKIKTPVRTHETAISLREYMTKYPEGLGMYGAVGLLLPVALQLRDMHNNGNTHLQVSPDSVLVNSNGAKLANATAAETDRYTSGYAAPEIYMGKSAGNLSDIYSFCAVLSFAASGRQPENALSRTEDSTKDQVDGETPEQFDAAFWGIVDKGMALSAENRFDNIQEVIIKVSPYIVKPVVRDVVPEEQTVVLKEPKPKRSRRAMITVAIICVFGVLLALVGGYLGCYFSAYSHAKDGDFENAGKLLLIPQITKLHDSQLVAYVEAGQQLDAREYNDARVRFNALSGYLNADELLLEVSYRQAAQLADANEFDAAINFYTVLSKKGYKDSSTKLLNTKYRQAVYLIYEKGEYLNAYAILDKIRHYSETKQTLTALTELIYIKGQTLYYEAEYLEAEKYFNCIANYMDSEKYITLIEARSGAAWNDPAGTVNDLEEIFYFEDAAELLLLNAFFAEEFLLGTWKGDGYSFTMKDGGDISYDLPWFDYGDYYYIDHGALYLYPDGQMDDKRALFYFEAITPDCIEVFCYKNNKSYTLYRQ